MVAFCWIYIGLEPTKLPDGLNIEFRLKKKVVKLISIATRMEVPTNMTMEKISGTAG